MPTVSEVFCGEQALVILLAVLYSTKTQSLSGQYLMSDKVQFVEGIVCLVFSL